MNGNGIVWCFHFLFESMVSMSSSVKKLNERFQKGRQRMTIEKCKNSGTVNSASILWGNAIKLELLTFSYIWRGYLILRRFSNRNSFWVNGANRIEWEWDSISLRFNMGGTWNRAKRVQHNDKVKEKWMGKNRANGTRTLKTISLHHDNRTMFKSQKQKKSKRRRK